ncbi:M15 family metallopeptidase [Permianibacter sp. IMCC34836]|uniref:M15 family metallopeptidase n=1 Tax=Permianibacter fluminis TaxID=2738515 RepID=UPI001557802B|nr:M15 family metallopeptidase [Permianibacter fluminis]NQD38092.1 M15 family metallopeptidase [Permianibacter fluminis]
MRRIHPMFLLTLLLATTHASAADDTCSYSTYQWNTQTRQAVNHQQIRKLRSELSNAEIDATTGCTVCNEDQMEFEFPGLRPFKACKKLADNIRKIVTELQQQQAALIDIVGYRVGMTRGEPDKSGNRTGFSNHSFGVALDINTEQNGLYDNCYQFGPGCRLIKGGPWNPQQPTSLTVESPIVLTFKKYGFKWGGEIAGKQKDFMHFSPSGY